MDKLIFTPLAHQPIKAIIFDLGGVVINIDYHATINAFKALGMANFEQLYSQAQQTDIFNKFEVGSIGANEFRDGLRQLSGVELSDSQINKAWDAMLLDFPNKRADLLRRVKEHYLTFLLSNTNEMHYQSYTSQPEYGLEPNVRAQLFHGEYFSHRIGKRKPNQEAFLHVLCQNNLVPAETLFIDDSIQHVEGARSVGIHAYHLDAANGQTIEDVFRVE